MKKDNFTGNSLAHTKWNCKYHVVFAPKYRRKVFYEEKRQEIREILRTLCQWKEVEIIEGEVCPDHIHLFLFLCQTRKNLIIIRALARAILPAIVQLFETEEGQKGFEEWRKKRRKQKERQLNNKINNDNLAHI